MQRGIPGLVYVLVVVVYAWAAHPGIPLSGRMSAADNYYNLLVQGFRVGQLSLKQQVPPALAQLANPYDPSAYASYREETGDMSYYKGKLYLYFGVSPAVMLFWPYVMLTGHYLLQRDAVVIFCLVGFLASMGLVWALWRRYFADVSIWVVAAGTLALGLAAGVPVMLARSDVYEVSISCGYALAMLTLAAIWKASHEPERRCCWLAAASMAYGLAVGARPDLLFGAVVLLVPVAQARRERGDVAARKRGPPMASAAAAVVPIALTGLGLMLYNALRFDSPFEFGIRYQLGGGLSHFTQQFVSLRYLWFNFRVYFLELARWRSRFPFVQDIIMTVSPVGHEPAERTFGVLTNIPLVWLALAVPLAWRNRSVEAGTALCGFLAAVAVLFGIGALTLGLCCYAAGRYEVEFLPALVLLAVVGILSVEQTLAPTSEWGQVGRPVWRRAVRWGWGLLLTFSVAFNVLASVERCAEWHNDLGAMLGRQRRMKKAIGHFEQALRLNPDYAEAHNNLGAALSGQGELQKAIDHYEQAVSIKPDFAEAHSNLGVALMGQNKLQEAIGEYEQALLIRPDYAEVHFNLAVALHGVGRMQEAIGHYEQALHLRPDYAEAHNNLGAALEQTGRVEEAIQHYEQALRVKPDYAEAHNNLGVALAHLGRLPEAIGHWEQALRLKPDDAKAHYGLGFVFERRGQIQEAIEQYEQALHLRPDFVQAHSALVRVRAAQ